ncbi:MAG: D-alanyl-D-alanine carboxypeptidase family protein [Alphaproteobacteria bacterium]|nr:D-alanyl-D-alanine carboxypeptidase family protein [Alphaproteobacteria bacterium]
MKVQIMKYKHTVADKTAEITIQETQENPVLYELNPHKYSFEDNIEYKALRQKVCYMLELARKKLPKGYQFHIFETYRSYDKQVEFFEAEMKKLALLEPHLSQEQLKEKANIGIADPCLIGSGHQTGGAIDLTILDAKGKPLQMGTAYRETENPLCATASRDVGATVLKNRYLLWQIMHSVGFVNYPLEWWHYSYGEQEWAVLCQKKATLYKALKNPKINHWKERERD